MSRLSDELLLSPGTILLLIFSVYDDDLQANLFHKAEEHGSSASGATLSHGGLHIGKTYRFGGSLVHDKRHGGEIVLLSEVVLPFRPFVHSSRLYSYGPRPPRLLRTLL